MGIIDKEKLRDRFNKYLKEEGVKQKIVSKRIHISEAVLSQFKNGKSIIGLLDAETLEKYLQEKGY